LLKTWVLLQIEKQLQRTQFSWNLSFPLAAGKDLTVSQNLSRKKFIFHSFNIKPNEVH